MKERELAGTLGSGGDQGVHDCDCEIAEQDEDGEDADPRLHTTLIFARGPELVLVHRGDRGEREQRLLDFGRPSGFGSNQNGVDQSVGGVLTQSLDRHGHVPESEAATIFCDDHGMYQCSVTQIEVDALAYLGSECEGAVFAHGNGIAGQSAEVALGHREIEGRVGAGGVDALGSDRAVG